MRKIQDFFGEMVFNDDRMRERLPKETYTALQHTIREGRPLDISLANIVANAMKDWAIERGATHYTHWFQPMTGVTAEKHDSFLTPRRGGNIIMEFSGKELIKGESDASSFPSGGLRATFEARGYTAWDPTSYAFVKNDVLCIPTAFWSYSGESLDKKTPLLRSIEALNTQALRILHLFGGNENRVTPTVGPEQEYFLIDRSMFQKRKDLLFTGRTLFGAAPVKGQELDDHYYGAIKPRVSAFMKDLDEELWKLGISAKTRHNEVAPCQHELAIVFTDANKAADHNQLTMETMRKVAIRHGLTCLLHEKPFAYVNGSGKHNNWSLTTDTGVNLFDPGNSPSENVQFLLFLTAVMKAVDENQDLIRLSVASAGNDHRLGCNEAPPAVISIFLGDELTEILESIETDSTYDRRNKEEMEIGVGVLPHFPKDTTDRNRTSPFAFTGNKFEFRMLGSSLSISGPNVILNTILAEALRQIADELESASDFRSALTEIIKRNIKEHKRIIFNGDSYSDEWKEIAAARGLLNLPSTPKALPYYIDPKNIEMFERHKVLNASEMHSRYEILLEGYNKKMRIEARTMAQMARREILPAVLAFSGSVAETALRKKQVLASLSTKTEEHLLNRLSVLCDQMSVEIDLLETAEEKCAAISNQEVQANEWDDVVRLHMEKLRRIADTLETLTDAKYWPFPTYSELFTSTRFELKYQQ